MAKARQQYFADETSIEKDSREFAIESSVMQKINGIEPGAQVNTIGTVKVNGTALTPDANKAVNVEVPDVIDNLYSTSTDDALSAKQGKVLYDYLQSVASRGRFLSNWNCATGLPVTNPTESPYTYKAGDYYSVSNVAVSPAVNYRPDGSSYTIGQASTVVETDDVNVSDFYLYDGTNWLLLVNTARQIAIDSSLSTTSTNPVENRVVTGALNGKQGTLTAGANISIDANNEISAVDTTYESKTAASGGTDVSLVTTGEKYTWNEKQDALVAGNNISIAADGKTISAVDTTYASLPAAQGGTGVSLVTTGDKYTWNNKQDELIPGTNITIAADGKTISATDTTYSAGDNISIDANNQISADVNTRTFYLSSTSDLTNAQAAYDWWKAGKNPIIKISDNNNTYTVYSSNSSSLSFISTKVTGYSSTSSSYSRQSNLSLYLNSDTVDNISLGNTSSSGNFLDTTSNYYTPYTPLYDGSPATKKYVDDKVDNTAYASSWDGVTAIAPSKDAVYDKISAMDTTIYGKQDTLVSGTNIKTVNSNSLLGSGNLTLNDVKVSSTAPSSPTEGMVWYDTTNDQLKVYDGSQWNMTGKEYNAGEGIEIGTVQDYSAMQGPAPDGFHVPSKDEWVALCGVLTTTFSMASNATTMATYLKMAKAGRRNHTNSNVYSQGSDGYYWSSTRKDGDNAYIIYFNSSDIYPQDSYYRSRGFSVRCFKDSPVTPDSSWTTLYDGSSVATGAGIFHNTTLGLISVSGDGTNWTTIADKNLGATTVYNSGDTLSEANCGGYFQRGNNYMFPFTGTITNTSTTQVDASAYGPGNYYLSGTFIKYNGRWDTTDNGNLWGGVTGVITLDNAITNTGVLSVNGQTGDVTIQGQHTAITVTLTTAGWSGSTQSVTATGVTASNTVIVSPDPSSIDDYTNAKVYCSAQASDSLTFTCSTTPTNDITVNVVILN